MRHSYLVFKLTLAINLFKQKQMKVKWYICRLAIKKISLLQVIFIQRKCILHADYHILRFRCRLLWHMKILQVSKVPINRWHFCSSNIKTEGLLRSSHAKYKRRRIMTTFLIFFSFNRPIINACRLPMALTVHKG